MTNEDSQNLREANFPSFGTITTPFKDIASIVDLAEVAARFLRELPPLHCRGQPRALGRLCLLPALTPSAETPPSSPHLPYPVPCEKAGRAGPAATTTPAQGASFGLGEVAATAAGGAFPGTRVAAGSDGGGSRSVDLDAAASIGRAGSPVPLMQAPGPSRGQPGAVDAPSPSRMEPPDGDEPSRSASEAKPLSPLVREAGAYVARALLCLAPVYLAGYLGLSTSWVLIALLFWMWWRRNRRVKLSRLLAAFGLVEDEKRAISQGIALQQLPAWVSGRGRKALRSAPGRAGFPRIAQPRCLTRKHWP